MSEAPPIVDLLLIRHAHGAHMLNPDVIVGGSVSAPLTRQGREGAFLKGEELRQSGIIFDAAYASPAWRCVETAELILEGMRLSLPITISPGLLEMGMGKHEGKRRADVYTDDVLWLRDRMEKAGRGQDFALPGAESANDVERRMLDWLGRLATRYAKTKTATTARILAVTHAGTMACTARATELVDMEHPELRALRKNIPTLGEMRLTGHLTLYGVLWHVQRIGQTEIHRSSFYQ